MYYGMSNDTIGVNFTAPDGLSNRYQFDIAPDNTFRDNFNFTPSGGMLYAAAGEQFYTTFTSFTACQMINLTVTVESGCGSILGPSTSTESVVTYTSTVTNYKTISLTL